MPAESKQPETLPENRLFAEGCALCGTRSFDVVQRTQGNARVYRYCCGCINNRFNGDYVAMDKEITRRKSLQPTPPAAEFRDGDIVSAEQHGRRGVRIVGRLSCTNNIAFPGDGPHCARWNLTPLDGGRVVAVYVDSVRHEPAQASAPECPECASKVAGEHRKGCGLKPKGNFELVIDIGRGDPYAHKGNLSDASVAALMRAADAARKKSQAADMLGSREHIRTGPLKNRDKYGQKVSLRGWETEE